MADYNSSLPVRTEAAGDVAVKIVDNTVTSQGLGVDSSGRITIKNQDGAGNALASSTTTPAGTEQALIVRNIPSGTQPVSGTVAATQSGTWSQRLQDGAGNAVTSQVSGAQRALDVGINVAGVQVDPRAVRALTSADVVSANIKDGAGNSLTSSAAGATRPLDMALRDSAGNLYGTALNPINVAFSVDIAGTEIVDFNTAAAIAAAGTSNHSYTVTAAKTLLLKQVEASASGKAKIEVQIETGVATNVYTTKFVQFNSTATTNMSIHLESPIAVAAGVRVRVIRTNKDNQAQDLYSTILGQEV
jgi:hypothetical protein